ncbi:DUF481 domain-containing protein [Puniceicoccaceae bacterium K14]|nr:DUF481 domain-containing protein [Puniceicoccaceae bacterium K14]
MIKATGLFLILFLFSAHLIRAEEETRIRIELVNGDLVSGVLVEENPEFVKIYSEYAGVVTINRSAVIGISFTEEIVAQNEIETKEPGPLAEENFEDEDGELEAQGWVNQFAKSLDIRTWKKRLEFGLTSHSGSKDKSDFSLRYLMTKSHKDDHFRLEGKYFYSETEELTTTDRNSVLFRWRHDIAPGIFYQTDSSYSSDAIKDIDYDLEQKFGLGYRFIERDKVKLSSGFGLTGRRRQESDIDEESVVLADFFQDWEQKFNKRISLYQDFSIGAPISESTLYEVDFSAAIVSEITETLNFTIRFELEYDNSLEDDVKKDQRLISSVGYDF